MKGTALLIGLLFVISLTGCSKSDKESESSSADSAINKLAMNRDTGTTASDQPENETDRKIIQEIRKSIVSDDSLSTLGKNVTVVSENGNVTLRGNVKDQSEKEKIASKAQQVAGVAKVDNQISVQ
jgi:hyperosmotically inducible periplasmic protein